MKWNEMNKFPTLVCGGTQECGRLEPEDIECDIYLSLSELVACRWSEVPSADRRRLERYITYTLHTKW